MGRFAKEPRVSVAIVNWNYANYVAEAIKSVRQQTYQNFHCVVWDNGSDDRSAEAITEAIDGHPQFVFHRSPQNLGHLGGAMQVLAGLQDDFVTFLDADDFLSPDYLASHLQVHLAAATAVGFTSSSCVEVNAAGSLLTGGNWWIHQSWTGGEPSLRHIEHSIRLEAVDDEAFHRLARATHYLSADVPQWSWSPGSSNMFRRVLLERVRPPLQAPVQFGGVDGFFLPILHAISGSHLINLPLSAYRVHGENDFTEMPGVRGVRTNKEAREAQATATFVLLMASLIERIDTLLGTISSERLWRLLDVIASTYPYPIFTDPRFKSAIAKQYPRLMAIFGPRRLLCELRQRMTLRDYLDVISAADTMRPDTVLHAICAEMWRTRKRLSARLRRSWAWGRRP